VRKIEAEESSGNVFADLGFPDAEGRWEKAMLSILISRGFTEEEAAEWLRTAERPGKKR
jgi:hypothetical protein